MNLTMEEKQAIEEMYLEHSGVMGMHWGQRRYQNPDGSLTALGRIHYGIGQRREARAAVKKAKVMQSGDAKTVLKYRKKLTDEEFDAAMARVAKTDALKANAYAEKNAKKAKKEQAQITKEERKNAEKIANQNANQKTNSKDFWDKIAKAAVISGNLLSLYNNVNGIAKGLGLVEDKKGKDKNQKEQKPQNGGGGNNNPKGGDTYNYYNETNISNDNTRNTKNDFNFSDFLNSYNTSNSWDDHRTYNNYGGKSDHFWDDVTEIIDADWTEVKNTPVGGLSEYPRRRLLG